MNHCPEMEELLNRQLDGDLDGAALVELEQHLEKCSACREALEELRTLQRSVSTLPRSLEPPRDLWPGVERTLTARRLFSPGRPGWRAALALTAAALIAAAATLFLRPGWLAPAKVTPAPRTAASPTLGSFRTAETDYLRAAEELLEELDGRRDQLSPQSLAVIEENLRVIDQAIQEVWRVLESDPDNPRNAHFFNSVYRKKLSLLRQAIDLPSQS